MRIAWFWQLAIGLAALTALGDDAEDAFKKGVDKQNAGDPAGAWSEFNNAIFLRPNYYEAYSRRGVVRQARGDLEGAMGDLNKAIALKPDFVEAYNNRGNLKLARGDDTGALADLNKAIELYPNFIAYFSRARLKQIEADLPGALADFDQCVQLYPQFPGTFYYRGCVQYDQRAFAKAVLDFEKVCQMNSNADYAHFRLWLARARLGQKEAATRDLQAYLDHRPGGPLQGWLAQVGRFLTGQLSEADFLTAAAEGEQKKSNALEREAWFLAGTTRLMSGDKATARDYFNKCVATNIKDDPDYQSAAAELKFLSGSEEHRESH